VLESFLKRVEEIENIAKSKEGIKQAYAINAGREIRVIANAKLINDDEAVLVAKEIAAEIESKGLSYLSVMNAIDEAIEAERSKK